MNNVWDRIAHKERKREKMLEGMEEEGEIIKERMK